MTDTNSPTVSVAIASFNSRHYLREAVASALAQTGVNIEIIIVDDGSSDGSDIMAEQMAAADQRILFLRTPRNLGPGGARNIAIKNMTGDWFAILDSDDLFEPDRCRHLIAHAEDAAADMVADDLIVFGDAHPTAQRHLGEDELPVRPVDLPTYLSYPAIFGGGANLGFLKPMIRREFLFRHDLRYDPSLRIGEDDMFVIHCLKAGAKYLVLDDAFYRYRKHAASVSHRLATRDAQRLLDANLALGASLSSHGTKIVGLLTKRNAQLANALAFSRAIDALKARQPFSAMYEMLRRPGAIPLFAMPLRSRLAKLSGGGARSG